MQYIYTNTHVLKNYLDKAEQWLKDNKIYHFDVGEVFFLGKANSSSTHRAYGLNHLPPKELWGNMEATIYLAEIVRQKLGRIKIISAYRSPDYNKKIGGKAKSSHLNFNALDLVALDTSQSKLYELLISYRNEGMFKGGLGKYNSFIHLDTRGYNATW